MPRNFVGKMLVIGLGTAIVGSCSGAVTLPHFFREEYRVKVTDAQVVHKNEKSIYRVYTQDNNRGIRVFENDDSLLECFFGRCKFDSSNVQAQLTAAKMNNEWVDITAYGFRMPLFSMYENVVKVTPVHEQSSSSLDYSLAQAEFDKFGRQAPEAAQIELGNTTGQDLILATQ